MLAIIKITLELGLRYVGGTRGYTSHRLSRSLQMSSFKEMGKGIFS